ncbi:MAG: Ger(x)C family spore germination protein [Candidatus Merdivicinus sp.]|jgi:Ger(x)C family germination protein
MKKAGILTAVFLVIAVLLSGCGNGWIRMVNLQNRAIVQGVGIDWDGENFQVTMQVFSPEGSGGQTMVDASKENARIITCTGASIAEAVEKSALNQGKEFYLGHNRIVILGWDTLDQPLDGLLSYFVNSLDSRPDVSLLATKGKASDIISANISQSILPAMSIENTVSNAERNGLVEEVFLIDVLEALSQPHRGTVIPFIETVNEEDDDEKNLRSIQIDGLGVFRQEGYVGNLTGSEVRGLLCLRDTFYGAVYTLESSVFERAAVQLYHSNTRILPNLEGETPTFQAEIRGEWTLTEKKLKPGCEFTEESLRELEEILEERIAAECEMAFQKVVHEFQSDVFYLGDLVWHNQPMLWKTLREEWPEGIADSTLQCDVHAEIDRTGFEGVSSKINGME